jgi:NitT/TauT family transport system substrate-binding protein
MRSDRSRSRPTRLLLLILALGALLFAAAGCSDDASTDDGGSDDASTDDSGTDGTDAPDGTDGGDEDGEEVTLRLGYFPNVTHAPAIVGDYEGFYEDALGDGVNLEISNFNQGSEASEALFADAIDATFIGPNPAINGFAQSEGEALRIVSGSTSGGAYLVTTTDITDPAQLEGTTLASPSLGNTQDVALRAWLTDEGFETDETGGGDVAIINQDNSDTLASFIDGSIDGAWVPEPWATRLIQEGGGHVLVDEADLWPEGQYVTTHLIVATGFLDEHPDVIRNLLTGHLEAINFVNDSPDEAQASVIEGIADITGQDVSADVIGTSWGNLTFTWDPIASSLLQSAADAEEVGLLDPVDLEGIYDLTLLNEVLVAAGEEEVSDS